MNWSFYYSDIPVIITSDNPVFLYKALIDKDSEVLFPVSNRIALLCHWKRLKKPSLNSKLIKEINSRILWNADRFVFAHAKLKWLERLVRESIK